MFKVIVRFIKGNGVYVAGDVTQIDQVLADKLSKDGIIEVYKEVEIPDLPDIRNIDLPEKSDKIICPICGKEFKTEAALKAHKKKAHKL